MKYYVDVNEDCTFWYKDAEMKVCHRDGGPALIYKDGDQAWYQNGKFHREDGPAIEHADGFKAWYKNGELHREDGPAIIWNDGSKCWYLDGKKYLKEEFNEKMNPVVELTVADIEKLLGKKVKIVK